MGALLSWGFELGTPWTWLGCRVPVVHVREEKENAALLSFEGNKKNQKKTNKLGCNLTR